MKIVDGKNLAENDLSILKEEVKTRSNPPSLGVVQVGKDSASSLYVKKKQQAAKSIGLRVNIYEFSEDISAEELKREISLIEDEGVIVQLPLPSSLDSSEILNAVSAEKDIDMLSDLSTGMFYNGTTQALPPFVAAVRIVMKEYNVSLKGAHVVLVGSGRLTGKPLFVYLTREGATVTCVNRDTRDISQFTKKADIVISATGSPSLIKGEMLKKGAVVIDGGSGSLNGVVKGDVCRSSVEKKASLLSPVPGGVGPLTVCCLMHNLLSFYDGS